MSKSDLEVRQRMLEKNVQIKQKAVNDSRPFISHNTQNLYKLPQETRLRTKLLDDIGSINYESHQNTTTPLRNAAVRFLEHSDSEVEEKDPQTE